MASQIAKVLLSLDAEAVGSLKEGVNFKKSPEDGKCYIIFKSSNDLKACKNQCKHQGGLFVKDVEDLDAMTVKCTKHNWKLNVSTMKYVNPPDSFLQDELEVEVLDDGGVQLVELSPVDPWMADPREPLELQEGEVKVTYLTHACMELQLGERRFMFDPWLKGPAFARGWWLLHEPPADAMDRLCGADLIYISHMHSDHLRQALPMLLNIHTKNYCYEANVDVFPDSWKAEFIKNERKKLLNYKATLVKSLQPRIYCPFAGYFVEAHPSDRYIKDTNIKNSAEDLNALINKLAPAIKTWTPQPGAVLDLGLALRDPTSSEAIINPPASAKLYKDSWEFDLYVNELNSAIKSDIFKHQSWIQFYYTWAGFQNYNLVVRVIETDDEFKCITDGYDYLVDFLDLSFPTKRPDREHAYLEIKNRIGVMRYVVLHGCLWDDLYIGFQNRVSRDPDVYHHKFWKHFQAELPLCKPDWEQFRKQVSTIDESTIPLRDTGMGNNCALS
uniref:Cytidine monophosphate-N-acetylneuraminic acid hydroxylase n=1 Tax=Neolamprologus brichardi TaxID=32507 RepID=A0A3Q4GPH6_NEOBR